MFGFRNNGPGPPFDDKEIVLILAGVCDLLAVSFLLRWVLVCVYHSYLAWKHLVR
jgi:hypothetical protein